MRRPIGRDVALVVGAVGLVAAVGARRPVIRRWPFSVVQAVPCLPAAEVPGAVMAVQAGAGVAALISGGVAGPLATVAALAALAGLRGDADRSAAALDAALAPLDLPPARTPRRTGAWGRRARGRYLRAADVTYGDDPAQRLDVWARPDLDPAGRAPVLVQVHGGGWTGGDKAVSASPLLARLAEHGWVCVTVNYRLGPGHRWPEQIADVKRAVAWVKEHIAGFGGDPGFVAISGGSAGGHLASLAALTPNDPDFQPGFGDADTTLAAAVPLYGVHDFNRDEDGLHRTLRRNLLGTAQADDPDTWRRASPIDRAHPGAPPFLVIHGSSDTIVSVGQSQRFTARMREVGAPVALAVLPHAQHSFDEFPTARTRHTNVAVHRFLDGVHARHVAERDHAEAVTPV